MKDSCRMACHAAHSLQHSDARRPSARPPGGQAIMRGITHFWITSNSATIRLVNTPLFILTIRPIHCPYREFQAVGRETHPTRAVAGFPAALLTKASTGIGGLPLRLS